MLSAQVKRRRIRTRMGTERNTRDKPESQNRNRASLNTYFAIQSQEKPKLQSKTLYGGGFKNQDLVEVRFSFIEFSLIE